MVFHGREEIPGGDGIHVGDGVPGVEGQEQSLLLGEAQIVLTITPRVSVFGDSRGPPLLMGPGPPPLDREGKLLT